MERKMYLDPGTGSIIIQAILAAVLGVGVFTRIFWTKIKALFGKKDTAATQQEDEE
jgi:hypothetical protein